MLFFWPIVVIWPSKHAGLIYGNLLVPWDEKGATFGLLVHGTTSHWFYGMLDGKIPGTSAKVVFSKVFIDQVLWNPIFGIMFFGYVGALEGKGVKYVIDKTKNDLLTAVRAARAPPPALEATRISSFADGILEVALHRPARGNAFTAGATAQLQA